MQISASRDHRKQRSSAATSTSPTFRSHRHSISTTLSISSAGGVEAPPSQGFTQNVALNLAVHSSNQVNLVSRTLSVGGSANLQVRGTIAEPIILGRANLTGGDIILNGNRFVLTGGTIQFVNPSVTQPVVNLTLNYFDSAVQHQSSLRRPGRSVAHAVQL